MTELQDDGDEREDGTPRIMEGTLQKRLSGIDLNLLIALESLLECRNVTHAARRLGQTQPAMSRSLARLRELLGDDLLVRSSTGLKLTAHGEYLASVVPAAMLHVRDLMSSRPSEAETRLSISNNLTPALLPVFLSSGSRQNEVLKIGTHKSAMEGLSQLRLRTADFVLGAFAGAGDDEEIDSEDVLVEDFVTLVASSRQGLGGVRPSRETFLGLRHINLVENGTEMFPQIGEALGYHGIRRSLMLEVPDMTAAALMVAESDLTLTVPRSIAGWLSKSLQLCALMPAIPISTETVSLAWLKVPVRKPRRRLIDQLKTTVIEAVARDQAEIHALRAIIRDAT